ncbi:hypothetical protein NFHSH190041_18950 [Shewanella sp. NFH-SH190041]|nr:hypothetical protein NFHSH190041_18950 [Shewanella sp. NFH-SH190041]
MNSESRGSEQSGFSLHYANRNDLGADIWMTAKAHQSNSKAAVILMLSCIDGISRVELALPNASDAGKAQITINGARGITRDWLSDDQGMVFQSARGLPAIDIIRVLMSSPSVTLRSDLQLIDKLKFDTSNLRRDITPLRKACRW